MSGAFAFGGHALELGRRTSIMGIINLTPDSFSDGGDTPPQAAAARALEMARDGADIIDVGGESTRPGYTPVPAGEQLRRVLPALPGITAAGRPVSIDTTLPEVAGPCLEAGAGIINDVSGLYEPYTLAALAAERGAGLIITFNAPVTGDAADGMLRFFERAARAATDSGLPERSICLDPGVGFCKTDEQNIAVIKALARVKAMGFAVMVGISRKSLLGRILGEPPERRLPGSLAALTAAVAFGADIVRVHDVAQSAQAAAVADALLR